MGVNHEEYAKLNPEPYQGEVTDPRAAQEEGIKCTVIEAANYYEIPPIKARFGDWVICEDGISCLYIENFIPKSDFNNPHLIEHVTKKSWVNREDFIKALETAKEMVKSGKI